MSILGRAMRPSSLMEVLFIDDQQKNVDAVAEVCLTHKTRQNTVLDQVCMGACTWFAAGAVG